MQPFQFFLQKILKKRKIFTEAKASFVIEKTLQILEDNLGETRKTLLENIDIQKFFEKKIYIYAKNPIWKHLISQHKKKFLILLQKEFSSKEIYDIIVS